MDVSSVVAPTAPPNTDPDATFAFLPNLMPLHKMASDDDCLHMFSLVHKKPRVSQGWRVMLRGFDLKRIVVDKDTITILEAVGGVQWEPLPGGMTDGTRGVYCFLPPEGIPALQAIPRAAPRPLPVVHVDDTRLNDGLVDALSRVTLGVAPDAAADAAADAPDAAMDLDAEAGADKENADPEGAEGAEGAEADWGDGVAEGEEDARELDPGLLRSMRAYYAVDPE
jgi:hypothetical protein